MPQRQENEKLRYFFVDEAGDPTFFDRHGKNIVGTEGCSKILLLGFILTKNPQPLREAMLTLRDEVITDPYVQKIPSLQKTKVAFHAKDDAPEVREKVYKRIVDLDFTAEFVVARKREALFRKRHFGKENVFYNDLIVKLFQNKLHSAEENRIYFAVRGNSDKQAPLNEAIQTAILTFEQKSGSKVNGTTMVFPQALSGEPCLQIVDYMCWAVQRAFVRGEDRYYDFVKDKVKYLVDVYDFAKYPKNFYSRTNQFSIHKISPL